MTPSSARQGDLSWELPTTLRDVSVRAIRVLATALAVPPVVHLTLTLLFALLPGLSEPLGGSESIDRLTWVTMLFTTAGLTWWLTGQGRHALTDSTRTSPKYLSVALFIASAFWLLSISWTQVLPGQDPDAAWWGFGSTVALASIALVVFGIGIGLPRLFHGIRPLLGALSWAVIAVWFVPLVIQPPWGVYDNYHTRYVVNEVLAPLSGNFALGTFTSQYTTLLGVPLLILQPLQAAVGSLPHYAIAVVWLSFLAALTVLLLIVAARLALPASVKILAPLLVVPLVLISQSNPSGYSGTITTGFAQYPGRILGFAALTVLLLVRLQREEPKWNLWLGLVAGAVGINNFEFGLSTVLVLILVLALTRKMSPTAWGMLALGIIVVPFLYLLLVFLTTGEVHPERLASFALGFGGGFGNIAMPVIGTWTAIAGMFIFGSSMGTWLLINAQHPKLLLPATLMTFASLAGLIHFGYYVGRSVTSGQLQLLLAHVALVIVAMVAIGASTHVWRSRSPQVGVLLLVCVLPIASLASVRPPVEEWSRISPVNKGDRPLAPDGELEGVATAIRQAQLDFPGQRVAVAGEAGNYLQLTTGASNVLLTNSPFDPVIVPSLLGLTCEAVRAFDGVVVTYFLLGQLSEPFCGLTATPYINNTYLLQPQQAD